MYRDGEKPSYAVALRGVQPLFPAEQLARLAEGRSVPWKKESPACRFGGASIVATSTETTMRFMMLMIPKGYERAKPGTVPGAKAVAEMTRYNESLSRAGILLAVDGLHPPSVGARVAFSGSKPTVTDGPFSEAKEVLGGYWMIQVKSREEALEWARRCPAGAGDVIEVRQVQEL